VCWMKSLPPFPHPSHVATSAHRLYKRWIVVARYVIVVACSLPAVLTFKGRDWWQMSANMLMYACAFPYESLRVRSHVSLPF